MLSSIVSPKKTVASVKSTFTTMLEGLKIIEVREQKIAIKARETLQAAEKEVAAAVAFRFGLGKLLAGE